VELLETIHVESPSGMRAISLYHGDLTRIPPDEGVDLLVISAFPNDYYPTPTSLIGALDRAGVSVSALAQDKAEDLREQYDCWLSQPIDDVNLGFARILCFEPARRGSPPEVVGDIFRSLFPIIEGGVPISTIAMSLVASGDARWPRDEIFEPLLTAAVRWLESGLRIDVIKIVERDRDKAEALRQMMARFQSKPPGPLERTKGYSYDVFISYSRHDGDAADYLTSQLQAHESRPTVFHDKLSINPGASWQRQIWEALDACRKVVALYSPTYLTSKVCQEEYEIAWLRHRESGNVLVPLYLVTADLPPHIRIANYTDCRESDQARLLASIPKILSA
jgi:hypothetical protein